MGFLVEPHFKGEFYLSQNPTVALLEVYWKGVVVRLCHYYVR